MSFPEISPAIFQIDLGFLGLGKFPIRWYALAYIGGLLIGWRYALALVKTSVALWGAPARLAMTTLMICCSTQRWASS